MRTYWLEAPEMLTAAEGKRAWTAKTLPVRRWHARQ